MNRCILDKANETANRAIKKALRELEEDNIDQVILDIGNKLTGQEIWYWESLVHLYREYKRRIDKAIEYIENNVLSYIDEDGLESITDKEENELLNILRGEDKR